MRNKKGVVLRDILFMMLITSSIIVFAGFFVSEIANNYDNTDMANEYLGGKTNILGNQTFFTTKGNVTDSGQVLADESTGIYSFTTGTLTGIGQILGMVLLAPNTIGDLIAGMLEDMGVVSEGSEGLATTIKWTIVVILWILIVLTIVSAFLQGGKL
jgi:hypothetical protein